VSIPYYADEHVTLYHGDCRELIEWISADVLVTDPPYGVSYTSHLPGLRDPIQGDKDTALRDKALIEWGNRPALVFGRWDIPRPAATRERLIWDKNLMGRGNLTLPWGRSDEEIYLLGDWPPVKPGGAYRDGGSPSRHHSVIRVQASTHNAKYRPDHPTPKPVSLMEILLVKCPPGTVADPFAGSGSTLVAARNLGRKAIGVEIEERYCETAARRLAQGVLAF
jgi:site-specific DNA-methyltransferase (adenine-specific)